MIQVAKCKKITAIGDKNTTDIPRITRSYLYLRVIGK